MDVCQAPTRFVVRASDTIIGEQGSHYEPGISKETAGAFSLFLGTVTLPAGQRTKAHVHHHESAHYMLSGDEIELWTGQALEQRNIARPGDYLFIPADMPHVAVNRGRVPAVFIAARSEASINEAVVLRPDLEGLVP